MRFNFLKTKDEVKTAFNKFKARALAENRTEERIKTSRTDNKCYGADVAASLEPNGMKRVRTVAYMPQQNGKAEQMNRMLVEMARCMLMEPDLLETFRAKAVAAANYLRNRCPTKTA